MCLGFSVVVSGALNSLSMQIRHRYLDVIYGYNCSVFIGNKHRKTKYVFLRDPLHRILRQRSETTAWLEGMEWIIQHINGCFCIKHCLGK